MAHHGDECANLLFLYQFLHDKFLAGQSSKDALAS